MRHPAEYAHGMVEPIRIETLREHAGIYGLHAFCPHCRHETWLNLMRIAQSVGWDVSVRYVHHRLRCSKCGLRGAELRKIHDGRPSCW